MQHSREICSVGEKYMHSVGDLCFSTTVRRTWLFHRETVGPGGPIVWSTVGGGALLAYGPSDCHNLPDMHNAEPAGT